MPSGKTVSSFERPRTSGNCEYLLDYIVIVVLESNGVIVNVSDTPLRNIGSKNDHSRTSVMTETLLHRAPTVIIDPMMFKIEKKTSGRIANQSFKGNGRLFLQSKLC